MGQPRLLLSSELGIHAEALAYPVGARRAFQVEPSRWPETWDIASRSPLTVEPICRARDAATTSNESASTTKARRALKFRQLLALIDLPKVIIAAAHPQGSDNRCQRKPGSFYASPRGLIVFGRVYPTCGVSCIEVVIHHSPHGGF